MNQTCKLCQNEVPRLNFSEEVMLEIWGLIQEDLKLFAVKKMRDELGMSHRDAKIVADHFNKIYGECFKCGSNLSTTEASVCPECGAFNINMKGPVFNQDFCSQLAFVLPFNELNDESVHGFWCDGIDPIPYDIQNLSIQNLKLKGSVRTRARTGTGGQEIYELTVHFGPESIRRFEEGQALNSCIHSENPDDWLIVHPGRKALEIKLM